MPELAVPPGREVRKTAPAVWILRAALAVAFVFAGAQKFPADTMWVRLFARIGLGQWFRYVTGIVEVAGGLLLLIPRATAPAVALLTCTMAGAILVHMLVVGVGPQTVAVSVLLTGVLAVGWTRRPTER
jgi:putative oxidoreductase